MSKRRMSLVIFLVVMVLLVLALAWYDGGREEPRAIEQKVDFESLRTGAGA